MIEEGGRESRKKSEEGKKERDKKEGEVLSLAFLFSFCFFWMLQGI